MYPPPQTRTQPLRVRVLSGCSCFQGYVVIYVCIPRPTHVALLSFVFLFIHVFLSAPVSSQDKVTPLHVAAVSGHAEVAKVLLVAGANVHACANHPSTGDVSGEEGGRLDYRDGVPYLRGEVG